MKIKKDADGAATALRLTENPDILATISKPGPKRPKLVIGFAAETNDIEKFAKRKLAKKGCDWIVANDVSGDVMGGAENEVTIYSKDGATNFPRMSKEKVAHALAQAVAGALAEIEAAQA